METELVLEVKLSLFVTAAVDDSAPLTRRGVADLVRSYLAQPEIFRVLGGLIDNVRVEQVSDPSGLELQMVPEGQVSPGVLGLWQ